MLYLVLILLLGGLRQDLERERSKVVVLNTHVIEKPTIAPIDAGPVVGDMLNAHYFPGIVYYNSGYYSNANLEFAYVIGRPQYLEGNPRRGEYLSTSYYLRGLIYFDHAEGIGRYSLARADFEEALRWNPNNYQAYIDLGRLYSALGFRDQGISVIQHLLELKPDETIAAEARKQIEALRNPKPVRPMPDSPVPATKSESPSSNEPKRNAPATNATTPAPPPRASLGTIAVNSTLPADIYSGNKYIGSTPATLELAAGEQTLEFRHQNLVKAATYAVKAGETLTATLIFDVAMDLNAQPWAEVFIAGSNTSLGQTPLSGVRVAIGSSLVFRHPSFPEKRYTVTGADRSVSVAFP